MGQVWCHSTKCSASPRSTLRNINMQRPKPEVVLPSGNSTHLRYMFTSYFIVQWNCYCRERNMQCITAMRDEIVIAQFWALFPFTLTRSISCQEVEAVLQILLAPADLCNICTYAVCQRSMCVLAVLIVCDPRTMQHMHFHFCTSGSLCYFVAYAGELCKACISLCVQFQCWICQLLTTHTAVSFSCLHLFSCRHYNLCYNLHSNDLINNVVDEFLLLSKLYQFTQDSANAW